MLNLSDRLHKKNHHRHYRRHHHRHHSMKLIRQRQRQDVGQRDMLESNRNRVHHWKYHYYWKDPYEVVWNNPMADGLEARVFYGIDQGEEVRDYNRIIRDCSMNKRF